MAFKTVEAARPAPSDGIDKTHRINPPHRIDPTQLITVCTRHRLTGTLRRPGAPMIVIWEASDAPG